MSKVDRSSYRIKHVVDGKESVFVGSGFLVNDGNSTKLVTAAHVAFDEKGNQRKLDAKQFRGDIAIDSLNFRRLGRRDIAVADVDVVGADSLSLGCTDTVLSQQELRIRPIYLRTCPSKPESSLKVIEIGGVDISRYSSKVPNPKWDREFVYESTDGSQPAWPGCSGTPVVDGNDNVVGVHVAGGWRKGVRRNVAHFFAKDYDDESQDK